jgi:hypothetical protein
MHTMMCWLAGFAAVGIAWLTKVLSQALAMPLTAAHSVSGAMVPKAVVPQ